MKKIFMLSFLLLFSIYSVNAMNVDSRAVFNSGNKFYSEQQYDKAQKQYLSLITDHKIKGASIYYNLANSYYQQGRIGYSILYYEKALLLAPRDKDIKFNLMIANKKVIDKTHDKVSFVSVVFNKLLALISIKEISALLWCGAVITLIGTIIFVNYRYVERVSSFYLYLCLPLFILIFILFGFKYYRYENDVRGVVLVDKQDVRSGPGDSFAVLFSVHEGLKFKVVKQISSGWMRIGLDNGLNGWIPKSHAGTVNPL